MPLTSRQQEFGYRFGIVAGMASITGLMVALRNHWKDDSLGGIVPGRPLAGLPTTGRIPIDVARRALKRMPPRTQACGITPELLREGMEVEREHRDVTGGTVGRTAKIAAAHLCERKDYYKRLKRYVEG